MGQMIVKFRKGMKLTGFLLLFVSMLACAEQVVDTAPVAPPRLVLVISIDQMRADYLTRFGDLFTGGFRRLIQKGAVFTNANFRHSVTETGPGHGVILSGRHGSHSGIIANEWYDRYEKKLVNVVDDPIQRPVGGSGRGASPANLNGYTIGDALKSVSPQSRVVSLAMKDRSAVLMGGKRADAAFWYDGKSGSFMSSTYYMDKLPDWLVKWNASKPADRYAGKPWTRLKPDAALYEKYAGPDAIEGEWDRKDIVFPHIVRGEPKTPEFYSDLRRFPYVDELTLDAALLAMHQYNLGSDETTDILAVSFSVTDYIGHTYGPDSQEIMDQLLRLDLLLEKLFQETERRAGADRLLIVLTADHGVLPLVEVLNQRGIDAKRVRPEPIQAKVEEALAKDYPRAKGLLAYFDYGNVYLDDAVMQQNGLQPLQVETTVRRALLETGLMEKVYLRSNFFSEIPANDSIYPLVRNSFYAPRSANVIAIPKKNLYISIYVGGTGHGYPYDYDRHVPVVFAGSGIKPGKYPAESGPEDIAPTLAHILKLEFPKEDDARVLSEMLLLGK